MKDAQSALDAWKHYAEPSDTAALKQTLWQADATPQYVNGLRSVCWKALLLFPDRFDATCLPTLRNSRSAYTSLRSYFLKAIENPSYIDETGTDPLSEDEQSLWNSLRADELVREEIWRDVERCMPDNEYFRNPRIQKYLLDVLFIWCKLNPDVGYRQGMHEILAPIIWVVDTDAVIATPAPAPGHNHGSLEFVGELLDSQYIEHDSFSLFAAIMQTAKSFYEPAQKKADDGDAPMIVRARHIFGELLPLLDPELARHLRQIDVLPQIFLMRWVRLIFGREFAFSDVLEMWDLIFSEGTELELVNSICIVMLLRIRWQLLQSDMNSALTLLLRYPTLDKTQKARDLVLDARKVLRSPTTDIGASIIAKYSGRPPAAADSNVRPSTPTLGTPPRMRGPFAMASSPASLENLLQDAAKGVMSTSEKWGLNQAVRDVVGEVKRGVERNLALPDPSSWSRSSSPRGFHARNRSTKAQPETHSMIAASALRKLNMLEERNRRLAETLQKTVSELWTFHEELVDRGKVDGKISNEDGQFAERLSRGVAEVQFVQAFLQDVTLPLPELPAEELHASDTPTSTRGATPVTDTFSQPPASNMQNKSMAARGERSKPSPTRSRNQDLPLRPPSIVSERTDSPSRDNNATASNSKHHSTQDSINRSNLIATTNHPPASKTALMDPFLARPRLTSSSFSWMLADNNTEGQQPFNRATPFAPNEKRSHAKSGKGFLFGEDDDEKVDNTRRGSGIGDAASSAASHGRGGAGRKGSKSKSGRGAASGVGKEREDIGLGDYGTEHAKPVDES